MLKINVHYDKAYQNSENRQYLMRTLKSRNTKQIQYCIRSCEIKQLILIYQRRPFSGQNGAPRTCSPYPMKILDPPLIATFEIPHFLQDY